MKKYERIRNLREDRDLTQEKLAGTLNLTQRTYSRYENGDSMMPLDVLTQLADYYGVSVDYLLGRTDVRKPYPKRKEQN